MKKPLLWMVMMLFTSTISFGQIANGSLLTEDITFTDLEDNEHSVYSYLDQGKTVILDLFAEWCGPCWNYHNTGTGHPNGGALKTLYNNYGPDGTDQVMVFAIETDPTTAEALMYGGAGTQGWDWVSDTPYPMANANIGNIFQQAYYPYIIMICPNRQIFEVGQQSAANILTQTETCLSMSGVTNPGILSYDGTTATCGNADLMVTIQNLGSDVLTSVTLDVEVDGSNALTYDWTGSLETFETASVNLGEIVLSEEADVVISITSTDDDPTAGSVEQTIAYAVETVNNVTVSITLDNYPQETEWEIRNEGGSLLADGGPYPASQALNTVTAEVSLPSTGCYTFTIIDDYGDGLNGAAWGGTNGNYTITGADGTLILSGGGNDQWYDESAPFLVSSIVSASDISFDGEVNVYPNPTKGDINVNINLNSAQRVTLEIFDVVGRRIDGRDYGMLGTGNTIYTSSLDAFGAGVYLVSITAGDSRVVKRIIVTE